MPIVPIGQVNIVLTEPYNPHTFFKTSSGPGLWVSDDFHLIVSKARPIDAGTEFKLDRYLLSKKKISNSRIESSLPRNHFFNESVLCAVIAAMIVKQRRGVKGFLVNNDRPNLFYIDHSLAVVVYWDLFNWRILPWPCVGFRWHVGSQVFSPVTVT